MRKNRDVIKQERGKITGVCVATASLCQLRGRAFVFKEFCFLSAAVQGKHVDQTFV